MWKISLSELGRTWTPGAQYVCKGGLHHRTSLIPICYHYPVVPDPVPKYAGDKLTGVCIDCYQDCENQIEYPTGSNPLLSPQLTFGGNGKPSFVAVVAEVFFSAAATAAL
jgi:hypothetical protein